MCYFCAESLHTKILLMQMIVIDEHEVTNCTGRGPNVLRRRRKLSIAVGVMVNAGAICEGNEDVQCR